MGVVMIPVLYFAGAGGTVFWIIGEDRTQPARPTLVTPFPPPPPPPPPPGASVVVVLLHAVLFALPEHVGDPELGIVMEDVTVS